MRNLGVPVKLGVEVTPEFVLEQQPDAVIVATGSRPKACPVSGGDGPDVFNVWQVLGGEAQLGQKVLLIDYDGHHQATATAEFLAELGKTVHVVTSSLFVGSELGPSQDLYLSRQRLLQKGVTFTPDFAVMEIKHPETGPEVHGFNVYSNVWDTFTGYDSVVTAMGNDAADGLYFALKGKVPELHARGRLRGAAPRRHGHSRRLQRGQTGVSTGGDNVAGDGDLLLVLEPPGGESQTGAALLAQGGRLARRLGVALKAVTWNGGALGEAVDVNAVADALAANVRAADRGAMPPVAVLLADSDTARELAPLLAHRLGSGAVLGCSDVLVDETGGLIFSKPVYGGWLEQEVRAGTDQPPVVTLDLSGIDIPVPADAGTLSAEVLPVSTTVADVGAVSGAGASVRRLEMLPPDAKTVDLVHARRIVAAGMGTAGAGLLSAVYELADLLDGSVGGTRPVVDEGRLPKERLIGQTGRTVAPDLYVALGISGSPHHVAGVRKADKIVAVNRDPRAPIFQFSDVGYVADLERVLPALVTRIKEWRDAGR